MSKAISLTVLLVTIFAFTLAQSLQPCQPGQILCYSDMTPYEGHGPAQNLPPLLCPNDECKTSENANRRVVVVRINTTTTAGWGATTPQLIWQATQKAINQWNSARDSSGNPTGYYFVLDQDNFTQTANADITITRDSTDPYLSSNIQNEPGSSVRTNIVNINPRYTTPGDPAASISAEDLAGSIAHEFGHLMGLVNNRAEFGTQCNSIMRGIGDTTKGTSVVKTVQPADVAAVNTHFASRNNCTKTTSQDTAGTFSDPTPTPTPTPTPQESGGADCNDWLDNDGDGQVDCDDPGCGHWCIDGCNQAKRDICEALGAPYCVEGQCYTPILIDTLGDGFKLTSSKDGVVFNLIPSLPIKIAWTEVNSDDAWLVLDRNGNGVVDNGQELFGNTTPQAEPPTGVEKNGFLALAEYDKPQNGGNNDGVITSTDSIFASLRLWQDTNHNGVSESAELHTLSSIGLATLELQYKESKKTDAYGNNFRYRAKVKDAKDAQLGRWAWDVFLQMKIETGP
jgi:hypothetical protein